MRLILFFRGEEKGLGYVPISVVCVSVCARVREGARACMHTCVCVCVYASVHVFLMRHTYP